MGLLSKIMGNSHSDGHDHHSSAAAHNQAAVTCFGRLSEGRPSLNRQDFERIFGPKIGPLLWSNIFGQADHIGEDVFASKYYDLLDMRPDQCINMFASSEQFLDACLSTVGKSLDGEKPEYVQALMEDINKEGGQQFFTTNCPGLAQNTIIRRIRSEIFPSSEQVIFTVDSSMCSPLQMLLIQACLPEMVYFKNKQATNPCWHKLYDSNTHGLSTNRFEGRVFGYNSPSVAIFKLTNGDVYSIANNTEWRSTTKYLGTSLSRCLQLAPHFKFFESRHQEPIFCNFKYRTADSGLGFRDVFTVSGDFDNVQAIEVWGCGSDSSLEDLEQLKKRQQMQTERNQKVPLPGEWDQNPDKAVLEMAGFEFSSERNKPQPPHDE